MNLHTCVMCMYSGLLQGEDETSMRHLSLYSLASHQVLSLELSVGATGLWLDTLPVFFNAANCKSFVADCNKMRC